MFYLLFLSQLWAQTIMVQGPSTPAIEYQRQLKKEAGTLSFIEWISKKDLSSVRQINELLKTAQFDFLNGSKEQAVKSFKAIVDQAHKRDWQKPQRKIIFYAFLRLAQMESDSTAQNDWLSQAYLFDTAQKPDNTLFPPPLLSAFNAIKRKLASQLWSLPKNSDLFDKVLINGQPISGSSSFVEHPPGLVRVQFLSNRFLPVTITAPLSHLKGHNLLAEPIASGDCGHQTINYTIPPSMTVKAFDPGCNTSTSPLSPPTQTLGQSLQTEKPSDLKRILKSKWFWVATSVVVTGLILSSQHSSRSAPAPSPSHPTPSTPPTISNK